MIDFDALMASTFLAWVVFKECFVELEPMEDSENKVQMERGGTIPTRARGWPIFWLG